MSENQDTKEIARLQEDTKRLFDRALVITEETLEQRIHVEEASRFLEEANVHLLHALRKSVP